MAAQESSTQQEKRRLDAHGDAATPSHDPDSQARVADAPAAPPSILLHADPAAAAIDERSHPDMIAMESMMSETPEEEATWLRVSARELWLNGR